MGIASKTDKQANNCRKKGRKKVHRKVQGQDCCSERQNVDIMCGSEMTDSLTTVIYYLLLTGMDDLMKNFRNEHFCI